MCGLGSPGCGILTVTGTVGCARALGVTVRGRDDCADVCLAVIRPAVTGRNHTDHATGHMTVTGLITALPFLLTIRSHGRGVGGLEGVDGIA